MKNKFKILNTVIVSFLFCFFSSVCASQENSDKILPAQSIEELQKQLEQTLKEAHIPGLSVAIVHRDGPQWVTGLGLADVASNRAATAETLFRIGSTSKAFASLAILRLADQAKLSLDDPVHKLVPEVWFENQWEASDPIRVVNLLEHTTGWDDMHFREYAKEDATIGLLEAFDYDHHSRISRWRPGTRHAYCNSGPAVAAYIVEKITGQRFEDYVEQNFFKPIGMKTATYFQPTAELAAATLYHDDGRTPCPYWHIIYRPAGSINASANDMANYLLFYLNRGNINGIQVIPAMDMDRMEIPASTWAAKEGLKMGYGLSNYWTVQDGFVYHGHNGGLEGGLTEMAYMPDIGIGYFYSINTGNGEAFGKIGKIIRAYITNNLSKPAIPPIAPLSAQANEYAGWYESDSPREELFSFLERLIGKAYIHFGDNKLFMTSLNERKATFLPVADNQFRYVPSDHPPEPIPTLALIDNAEGRFIQFYGMATMKRIPTGLAISEIVITGFVLLSVISILIYAPFWIIGGLRKKRRRPLERMMRIWPLAAVLSLISIVSIISCCGSDIIPRLGNLTIWSFSLFLATIVFAVASIASVIAMWRTPKQEVRPRVRMYSMIVSAALMIATAYFTYWGIIGLRTWA